MIPGSVARRYARAMFELATEDGDVDPVADALEQLASAVEEAGPEALAPGLLSREERVKLGDALAEKFAAASSSLAKFVRMLCDRERIDMAPLVHEWFVKMRDEAAGKVKLTITAANPLSDDEIARICSAFQGLASRQVVPEVTVDEKLVGGALVELDGKVYDGSVRTYLAKLAANMAGETS